MKTRLDTVYYSNPEEKGSRIARDLTTSLISSLADNLKDDKTVKFLENFLTPIERELYGLFIKSLLEVEGVGYIATEVQAVRNDERSRIDFLTYYRNKCFLFELKVGHVGIRTQKDTARIVTPWHGAENMDGVAVQASSISIDPESPLGKAVGNRKVILCPMVIYFYCTYDQGDDSLTPDEAASMLIAGHDNILRQLTQREDNKGNTQALDNPPEFHMVTRYAKSVCTSRRQSRETTRLYGFSLFASARPV